MTLETWALLSNPLDRFYYFIQKRQDDNWQASRCDDSGRCLRAWCLFPEDPRIYLLLPALEYVERVIAHLDKIHPDWKIPENTQFQHATLKLGWPIYQIPAPEIHVYGHLIFYKKAGWVLMPAQLEGVLDQEPDQVSFLLQLSGSEVSELLESRYGFKYPFKGGKS